MPLFKLKHFARFVDFVNTDSEFMKEPELSKSIFDISLDNYPVDEVSLKIPAKKARNLFN
jgi:hypothetical protein